MSSQHHNKKRNKKTRGEGGFQSQIPRPFTKVGRSPVDPEAMVKIPFTIVNNFANAATYQTQAYKINSLADSNIVYVGITAWASLYTRYRVVGVQMHIDALGTASTYHHIGAFGLSPLVTAIASPTDVLNFARMTNSIGVTVGLASGSSIERRSLSAKMVNIEGTENVMTDNDYTGATSAVSDPTSIIYLHVASRTLSANAQQGFGYVIRGSMNVQFFERKNILS